MSTNQSNISNSSSSLQKVLSLGYFIGKRNRISIPENPSVGSAMRQLQAILFNEQIQKISCDDEKHIVNH